jgi:hypothetical protein
MINIFEEYLVNHTDDLTNRRAYNVCEYAAVIDASGEIVVNSKNFEVYYLLILE